MRKGKIGRYECNEEEKAEAQIPSTSKFIRRLFFTLENNVENKKKMKSNERLKDTVLTRN